MQKHNLTLHNRPFYSILDQTKDIEGRVAKPKYKNIKVGDRILLTNVEDFQEPRTLEVEVLWKETYPTLQEALSTYDPERLIPGATFQEAEKIYYQFYPDTVIRKYGMLLLGIELKEVHPKRLHDLKV